MLANPKTTLLVRILGVVAAAACLSSAYAQSTPQTPPTQAAPNTAVPGASPSTQNALPQSPAGPSVNVARPADTIGEVADRQRMERMFKTQKPSGPSAMGVAGQPGMPGITVVPAMKAAPSGMDMGAPRAPAEPEMQLTEVMSSPILTVATIEMLGVERKVSKGDELGNGWSVKKIDRYSVELVKASGAKALAASEVVETAKGKKVKAKASAPLKTQTLVLRASNSQVAQPGAIR